MRENGFKKIGFIGLGVMGSKMCERLLLLENDLYVFDVSQEAMQKLNESVKVVLYQEADNASVYLLMLHAQLLESDSFYPFEAAL